MSPSRPNTFSPESNAGRALALNAPMIASLIALSIIVIIALTGLATTLGAAFGIGVPEDDPSESLKKMVAANQEKMQTFQERFNGRSVFYKPSPWPQPQRPIEPVKTQDPIKLIEKPPEPSIVYTGPGIWYAIGDVIRFRAKTASDKPFDVRVGEEKNGVRVISTNLPWTVRVGYQGGEYDVNIWERKPDKFLLAQAPSIEIIPGLIEVPPPRPVVDVPKASGEVRPDITAASAAPMEEAAAQPAARPSRREARTNRQPPQGRPQAQPARQTQPARGATAPDPAQGEEVDEEEDDEEVDEEPNDPATEEDPEAARAGREGAPQPDDPNEDQDEPEDAENAPESAGDAFALAPQRSTEPPSIGTAT